MRRLQFLAVISMVLFSSMAMAASPSTTESTPQMNRAPQANATPQINPAPQTSQLFLGYNRAANFNGSPALVADKAVAYNFPDELPQDNWVLKGNWTAQPEKICANAPEAAVKVHFRAGKVFVKMDNPKQQPIMVTVLLNGKPIGAEGGKDVVNSKIKLTKSAKSYEVAHLPKPINGVLELNFAQAGAEVYDFTFSE